MLKFFGCLPSKWRSNEDHTNYKISDIGVPTNFVHGIHVSKNDMTGDIEGLPLAWLRIIDSLNITSGAKFYNYSIEKQDNPEQFKPFITEDAISEESEFIDDVDEGLDDLRMIDEIEDSELSGEELLLRVKDISPSTSDQEVFTEIRRICSLSEVLMNFGLYKKQNFCTL